MQSPFKNPDSRKRFVVIAAFIQDLRLAKSLPPFEPGNLADAAKVWDGILQSVDFGFMTERGENSLFWMASRMGYIEAEKVRELFELHSGIPEKLDASEQARREEEEMYAAQGIPCGPGRRSLQAELAANGWPEERLLKFAELR